MKILFFISSLSLKSGGPSRSVPMMAKGLAGVGVEVTLMTNYSDDMNTHALEGTSVNLYVLEGKFSKDDIEAYMVKESFDIVQLQSLWSLDYHKLAQICRKHHIPYLITPRGMLEPWSLQQKAIKKKLAMLLYQKNDLNKAACIYTTAQMEAQNVHNLGIKTPCSVIPNGIETDGYPCRMSGDIVKKQILFLSRIHVKKGIELLIDAWKVLVADFPDWKIKIVGNGEEEYILSLKEKISKSGLQESIEILPPVFGQAKIDLYQSSALFVLPSYSENFGMVIAEAMSCGIPVITSEFTPWDFLNEEKAGWCIKLDQNTLEITIREALTMSNVDLYEMGQNAAKLVRKKYDYRNVTRQIIQLYGWLLHGGEKPEFVFFY